jgi:hypothetical protein
MHQSLIQARVPETASFSAAPQKSSLLANLTLDLDASAAAARHKDVIYPPSQHNSRSRL